MLNKKDQTKFLIYR